MDPELCGFYGFRRGFPSYTKSVFMNKCEIVTDSFGKILGVTNKDKLLWASVPSNDGEIQILEIADGAFENAKKLREITFADNLEIIGENAFKGCTSLFSITLPGSLFEIKSGAFEKSGLKSFVFPPLIEKVPPRCFMDSLSLESVVLSEGIREIGVLSFAGLIKLRSIDLPRRIEEIPEGAFMSSGLTSLYLPHSIKYIGASALSNCRRLNAIYYDGKDDDFRAIKFGRSWNRGLNGSCALYLKDDGGLWYNAFEKKSEKRRADDKIESALALFGLSEIPSKEELSKIFHTKAMAFHPDRIASKDLDKEFMQFAEEKFKAYKDAYDILIKYIG